jgi:hypothetical protein
LHLGAYAVDAQVEAHILRRASGAHLQAAVNVDSQKILRATIGVGHSSRLDHDLAAIAQAQTEVAAAARDETTLPESLGDLHIPLGNR